jgi:hypothetical protein
MDKAVIIASNDPAGTSFMDGPDATIRAAPMHLAPQAHAEVMLSHYLRGGHDLTDRAGLAAIRGRDSHATSRNDRRMADLDGKRRSGLLARPRQGHARAGVDRGSAGHSQDERIPGRRRNRPHDLLQGELCARFGDGHPAPARHRPHGGGEAVVDLDRKDRLPPTRAERGQRMEDPSRATCSSRACAATAPAPARAGPSP